MAYMKSMAAAVFLSTAAVSHADQSSDAPQSAPTWAQVSVGRFATAAYKRLYDLGYDDGRHVKLQRKRLFADTASYDEYIHSIEMSHLCVDLRSNKGHIKNELLGPVAATRVDASTWKVQFEVNQRTIGQTTIPDKCLAITETIRVMPAAPAAAEFGLVNIEVETRPVCSKGV